MKAAEIAAEIDHQRFIAEGASIPKADICAAAGIITRALRRAEADASRLRWIYRAGLRLAIAALEEYQRVRCAERASVPRGTAPGDYRGGLA